MTTPSAPQNLVASTANSSITYNWSAPADSGTSALTKYHVHLTKNSDGSTTDVDLSTSTFTYTFTGLTPNVNYNGYVAAYNSDGAGAYGWYDSIAVIAGSSATVPTAPTIGTLQAGNGYVDVYFTISSSDGGSAITQYTASLSNGNSNVGASSPIRVTTPNGTSVYAQVKATNGVGDSPYSSASNSVTPSDTSGNLPNAPVLTGIQAGLKSAIVSFDPSTYNGGSAITQYTAKLSNGQAWSGSSSPITVPNSPAGQAVTAQVEAQNANGVGPWSNTSGSVTPYDVPAAPTNVNAGAGAASATVSWTAPSDNGSAILDYTITSNPGSLTATVTGTSGTVSGLTNGTTYTFTVTARNAGGSGAASAASNSVVPTASAGSVASVPGAPTITSVQAGYHSVIVSFNPPSSDGGAPISLYTAKLSNGQQTSGTSSPITVTNSPAGTYVTAQVDAQNSAGVGPWSEGSVGVTPFDYPGQVTGVSATAGDSSATISWSTPSNGGSPILDYKITASPGGSYISSASSPATMTGLANGVAYTFTVAARNQGGYGATSAASNSVTPQAASSGTTVTAPGVPTNIVATLGSTTGQVNVSFAPGASGGATVTYKVTASPGGATITGAGSPLTVSGLSNGITYTFTVIATNSAGSSAASSASNSVTIPSSASSGGSGTVSGATYTPSTYSNWPVAPLPGTSQSVSGYGMSASFLAWLRDPSAIRCLLAEVSVVSGGSTVTRYLASTGFVTGSGDSPASTAYLPYISGDVTFTEELSLTDASTTYADIELDNTTGLLDAWKSDVWTNKPIDLYFGDVRWPRSSFVKVFSGMVSNLQARDRNTLNITLVDKLQRLDVAATDVVLGGTTQSANTILPLVFGEVHNMTPVLIDPSLHTYQYHQSSSNQVIEVRDNGAPISVLPDPFESKFTLVNAPTGTITCSVQGDNSSGSWNITVASIIKQLVKNYGVSGIRFTDSDIDLSNFNTFDTNHQQPVGIVVSDNATVLTTCQALATSVGAQLICNRLGLLQLVKLQFPGWGTALNIGLSDMYDQSLSISEITDVVAAIKLGYCKNWTVQNNLSTGILEEHKARFAAEWDTKTVRDASVAANYSLDMNPTQKDTMMLREVEAEPEAWRLLALQKVPHTVYQFDGLGHLLQLGLGQAVTLTSQRYGLSNTAGIVVSISPTFPSGKVTVKVMV